MRMIAAALVAACIAVSPATAGDFAKTYKIQGNDPGAGGGSYTGTVTLSQTGEATWQVVWTIAGETYVGTGIGSASGLAVAYKSGSKTGIAIYRAAAGGSVEGYWTYAGGTDVGRETWSPK